MLAPLGRDVLKNVCTDSVLRSTKNVALPLAPVATRRSVRVDCPSLETMGSDLSTEPTATFAEPMAMPATWTVSAESS